MHDLLIVGGGPGGVAAAAYGQHLGLDVLVIAPDLGGKVNYPFSIRGIQVLNVVHGAEMVRTFAAKLGPTAHLEGTVRAVTRVDEGFAVTTNDGNQRRGRTLIVTTGAKPRRLYVPGEERLWGHGLSYSAVSHAPFFVGKDVAVIGNDRRAQIAALELCRLAHRVLFIAPQPQTLDEGLMARIQGHGGELFKGWEVTGVTGEVYLSGISLQNKAGNMRDIKLDGVFVEMGLIPNSDWIAPLVERDEDGYIKIDQNACTSDPAIFAAGDVTNVYGEQVPIALGDGIKAALSASEYLVSLEQG